LISGSFTWLYIGVIRCSGHLCRFGWKLFLCDEMGMMEGVCDDFGGYGEEIVL